MTRARAVVLGVSVAAMLCRTSTAICLGDCNGDGKVLAGEVAKAVAVIVQCGGIATGCAAVPGGCVNADKSGNGFISAGEVINIVANILTLENGCIARPSATPTPINTPSADNPTSTATPTPVATQTTEPGATDTAVASTPTATASATETSTPAATATETPSSTPTPTDVPVTPTSTATPTSTPILTVCGNGFLENGETCASCAADCTVHACTATTPVHTFTVNLGVPASQTVSGVTVLVGYRSGTVSLPGSGAASTVGARVKNKPSNSIVAVNDLDYALRVVLSRSAGLSGRLFTIDFDSCQGAATPTAADFGCTVEGCANTFGSVQGCICTVAQ